MFISKKASFVYKFETFIIVGAHLLRILGIHKVPVPLETGLVINALSRSCGILFPVYDTVPYVVPVGHPAFSRPIRMSVPFSLRKCDQPRCHFLGTGTKGYPAISRPMGASRSYGVGQ